MTDYTNGWLDEAQSRALRDADPADLALAAQRFACRLIPDERLSAYEAAVDALERLANAAASVVVEPRRFHTNEDGRQQALGQATANARAALRRLRGES